MCTVTIKIEQICLIVYSLAITLYLYSCRFLHGIKSLDFRIYQIKVGIIFLNKLAQCVTPANILNTYKFSLVNLTKQDYGIWSAQLELLFQYYKLWDVVSRASPKPIATEP